MCRYHFDVWSGSDSMKKNQIDSFSVFSTRGKSASNVLFLSQNNINTEKKIIIWCNVGKMFLNSKICHKICYKTAMIRGVKPILPLIRGATPFCIKFFQHQVTPHCTIQSRCFSEFCIKARELAIVKLMYMYGGLSAVDDQLHVRVDRSLIWIINAQ